MRSSLGVSTLGVWAGEDASFGAHLSIAQGIAFEYTSADEWLEVAAGEKPGHIYSRNTNPTVAVFEEKVRQLEGSEAAVAFSSGMAAISDTLRALLRPGDRVVSITDTYGGTNRILSEFLPRAGIRTTMCGTDEAAIEKAILEGCRLVYLESPTNPMLDVVDIARIADAAHHAGALVVVDNTLATPINQRPLRLGADVVVHSASKYLGGHGDALGGVACGSKETVDVIFRYREINGAALSPFGAYLLARGLRTLELRVTRQNANAMRVAVFLEGHPAIGRVYYPGLTTHPKHRAAKKQMTGFGGVLSFTLASHLLGHETCFLDDLQLARKACSLGHVETLAGIPATTSHVECSAQARAALGIPEGLVRYSAGIEDADDLIADLDSALTNALKRAELVPA